MVAAAVFAVALSLQQGPFPDVPANHWAASAVQNLKEAEILHGYPGKSFSGPKSWTAFWNRYMSLEKRLVDEKVIFLLPGMRTYESRYSAAVLVYACYGKWADVLEKDPRNEVLGKFLKFSEEILLLAQGVKSELDSMGASSTEVLRKLKDLQKRTKDIVSK